MIERELKSQIDAQSFVKRIKGITWKNSGGAADLGTKIHSGIESILLKEKTLDDLDIELRKIEKVLALRKEGLSYDKIAKQTKISRSSVIKIVKTEKKDEDRVIDAWVYKDCPNPISSNVLTSNFINDFLS